MLRVIHSDGHYHEPHYLFEEFMGSVRHSSDAHRPARIFLCALAGEDDPAGKYDSI